jgi:hypothetical protein
MHRILLLLLLGLAVTLGADRSAQAYDYDSPTITEARAVDSPSVTTAVFDWAIPIDVTTADILDVSERPIADVYLIDRHEIVLTARLSIRIDATGMQTNLAMIHYRNDDGRRADDFADGAVGISS